MKNIYLYISLTFVFAVTMISALNAQALGMQPMADHTLVLNADGTVYAWGNNSDGQLGDDNAPTDSSIPVKVLMGAYGGTEHLGDASGNPITAVASGFNHSIALAEDGTVYTWGSNSAGQLGNDNALTNSSIPVKVLNGNYEGTTYLGDASAPPNKITAVALGKWHSIALAEDGELYAWGGNDHGQLGDNSSTDRHTPINVTDGAYDGKKDLGDTAPITAVALGEYHSIALCEDGTVYSWGYNNAGQLGDGTNTEVPQDQPVKILAGEYIGTHLGDNSAKKITSVALGRWHSTALCEDGTVYSWGYGSHGQMGNYDPPTTLVTPINTTPKHVSKGAYEGTTYLGDVIGNPITAVDSGFNHSIALAVDGTVYTWGDNTYGQLGDGARPTDGLIPVKVPKGDYGGTTCLGDALGNKITAVALGANHSIALDEADRVYTWGNNTYGQLGDNTFTERLLPIIVVGDGGSGELGLPVELSSFTAKVISTGVQLKWTTESEIENLGFILERKTWSTDWLEIISYKTDSRLLGQGSISSSTDYEYLDVFVRSNTTYEYRLADIDYNGVVTYHSTREVKAGQISQPSIINEFTVLPAYPNPFNPSVTIRYGLDIDSYVTVEIYDITGKLISAIIRTEQSQGWHSVVWNGTIQNGEQAPTGQYISKITSDNKVKTTKLMLLR